MLWKTTELLASIATVQAMPTWHVVCISEGVKSQQLACHVEWLGRRKGRLHGEDGPVHARLWRNERATGREVTGQAPAVTQQQTQWLCCLDPSGQERMGTQKNGCQKFQRRFGVLEQGKGGVQRKRKGTFLPLPSNSSSHFFPLLSIEPATFSVISSMVSQVVKAVCGFFFFLDF